MMQHRRLFQPLYNKLHWSHQPVHVLLLPVLILVVLQEVRRCLCREQLDSLSGRMYRHAPSASILYLILLKGSSAAGKEETHVAKIQTTIPGHPGAPARAPFSSAKSGMVDKFSIVV